MRSTRWGCLALGIVLVGVASGCRSLPSPPSLLDGGLIASSAVLSPEGQRAAQVHAFYSIGIHHELADEYDLAAAAYRQAWELVPDNERLVLRLASMLLLQRQTEEAVRTVEDFLAQHPASTPALEWLAEFYTSTAQLERATTLYTRLTYHEPTNPKVWLKLAAVHARAGNANAAQTTLEEGVTKALPPTLLQQELVRTQLAAMQNATDSRQLQQERQEAIRLLQTIAIDLPGDLDTLNLLGELLYKDGQLAPAAEVFQKIVRLQPKGLRVKQRLAQVYLALDDQEAATLVLEELAQHQGQPINVHLYLADMQLQAGQTNRAMEQLRLAAAAEPTDPTPWLKLAALQADDQPKQAAATLQKALTKIPGNPHILEVLALLRLSQNRYKQAGELLQQAYDAAMATEPATQLSPLFYFHIATTTTYQRQIQAAADWLKQALDMEADIFGLYLQRAITGSRSYRKNSVDVLRFLAEGAGRTNALVFAHLAVMELYEKKPKQAIQRFDQAIALAQADPLQTTVLTAWFYFWFGVALDEAKQGERAEAMFEKSIDLDPDYAEARNYLAYIWALQGIRLDEALHHIQVALLADPHNAAFIDTMGWVYFKMGKYEDALDLLQQANELRPNDPEIMDHLQQTLEKLGR